jgi:multiple sugar transport system substrate-binding protein
MKKPLFARLRDFFSTDKTLWIWAIAMSVGLLVFYLLIDRVMAGSPLVFSQWWEDELDKVALEKIIQEFEDENPGIRVRLEKRSRAEISELLLAGVPANGRRKDPLPDVFSIEGAWADDLKDSLKPLDGISGLSAGPGLGLTPGDRALPVISFINPLFYNIKLLQESGFDRPPKNQTEFLSYAQAITKPEQGMYGVGFGLEENDPHSVSRYILSWIWAGGIYSDLEGDFNFNIPQVVAVFNFLNELKPYLYPDPFSMTEEEKLKAFVDGKIGMTIGSVSEIKKIRAGDRQNFGITTIPSPPPPYVGMPVFALSSWYIGISGESKKPEEAEKFAAFLIGRAPRLAAGAFAVPGNGERDPELARTDPFYTKAFDMYDAGKMVREIYGEGRIKELNTIIYEETKRMFAGLSPEETAAAIQSRWENG